MLVFTPGQYIFAGALLLLFQAARWLVVTTFRVLRWTVLSGVALARRVRWRRAAPEPSVVVPFKRR